jgi:hypothetical protein
MKKLKVYVVGFEADPINGGVSGYNWFSKKEDADKNFITTEKFYYPYNTEVYRGELEIEVSNNYSATEEQREEVTKKVELFLEENDWENSFA